MMLGGMRDALAARAKLSKFQKEMRKVAFEGTGEKGRVKVILNGLAEVVKVEIDPELLDPKHKAKIEKGLRDALEEAKKKATKFLQERTQELLGELVEAVKQKEVL